ncbi:MAG: SH3 beta-barrel fold-containing protein [Prevotellaceae bacterium]|nr:SH3 beta-barrel fold-containing protein [Prevotellaceae bacterium]
MVEKLHKGIVSFTYRKKDGSIRHAEGTLYGVGHTIKGTNRNQCSYTLKYYDVDCKGWRCFIIDNLVEVGEVRKESVDEHHNICLALVVKLKQTMKENGKIGEPTSFTYRKVDGTIRHAHGFISDNVDETGKYFIYFDTDKNEERKFRIDSILGIGEPEEIDEMMREREFYGSENSNSSSSQPSHADKGRSYNDFSTLDIKTILSKKGIDIEDTENFMVIDLLPELDKEQLKDLIIKATTRLVEL